jgi:2-methylcitrate dehydratase PrpD
VANRRDTLSSAAYQLALAVVEPAGLQDVARPVLRSDPAFRALMARVAVHAASDLSARYPDQWPARVRITTDAGACTLEATADSVPGEQELTAEGLRAKVTAFIPAVGLADVATELVERALNLADVTDLAALAAGLDEDSPTTKEPRP